MKTVEIYYSHKERLIGVNYNNENPDTYFDKHHWNKMQFYFKTWTVYTPESFWLMTASPSDNYAKSADQFTAHSKAFFTLFGTRRP